MDFVFTFALVSLVILIACIFAYRYYTNSIIKDQEKEIAKLRTENFRLQSALKRNVRTVRIYDDSIEPENVPNFEKDW